MNFDDFFPSTYLKALDLDGEDKVLTIENLESRLFDEGQKPVLSFEETSKQLVLNRTNFGSIARLHGRQTGEWPGKRIALFGTEVSFRGTPTMAIRVRLRVPD